MEPPNGQLEFSITEEETSSKNREATDTIDGLRYIENYIDETQETWLLTRIEQHPWLDDLKRRVQHYGFKYDYRARKVNLDMRIGALPDWLHRLSQKLHDEGHLPELADQVIINEYLPGQGIANHIDCEPCFEGTIASLSLHSACVMNFTNRRDRKRKLPVWLEPRSLIVLQGDARYEWLHGITGRKTDDWEGERFTRQRRVSLTFRKVIL